MNCSIAEIKEMKESLVWKDVEDRIYQMINHFHVEIRNKNTTDRDIQRFIGSLNTCDIILEILDIMIDDLNIEQKEAEFKQKE